MDVDIDVNTPLPLPIMASSDEESLPGSQQQLAAGMLRDWSDARLERVASYTTTTMRLKPDKWCKMMANDDFRVSTRCHAHTHPHTHSLTDITPCRQCIVLDWLHGRSRVLIMTLSPGSELVPRGCVSDLYRSYMLPAAAPRPTGTAAAPAVGNDATSVAATAAAAVAAATTTGTLLVPLPLASSSFTTLDGVPRGKCAYFIRHSVAQPLTAANFQSSVLYGDFPVHSKIETMSLLFDEVLQPLLERAERQWPQPVRQDLQARLKEVRNTLTEVGIGWAGGWVTWGTSLSLRINPIECSEAREELSARNLFWP